MGLSNAIPNWDDTMKKDPAEEPASSENCLAGSKAKWRSAGSRSSRAARPCGAKYIRDTRIAGGVATGNRRGRDQRQPSHRRGCQALPDAPSLAT